MNLTESIDQELASLRAENAALRAELEETNQGVLALYAELDQQAEQLREVSELKSRFLSYMSHEFRTPLGSILSMTRLLDDDMDGPLSDGQRKQVRFVSAAALELREMVDDLLDLAKIEAGRITISPAWFDLMDLFSALRGMFRPLIEGKQVDLVFEDPPPLPMLYTDDKKLAQILRNFISNALKFTPHGHVRVSARPEGEERGALLGARHRHRHSPGDAGQVVRGLRPGRYAVAEAPARYRPGPVAVSALRRTARRPGRRQQRPRRRLGVLRGTAPEAGR